jgi:hypothetical protein
MVVKKDFKMTRPIMSPAAKPDIAVLAHGHQLQSCPLAGRVAELGSLGNIARFMKILHPLMLAGVVALAACATAPKMNRLILGMTKREVVSAMGKPASTSAPGDGVELLHYHLSPQGGPVLHLITEEYVVKLVNGKVVTYGKMGEIDSSKDPILNLNTRNR